MANASQPPKKQDDKKTTVDQAEGKLASRKGDAALDFDILRKFSVFQNLSKKTESKLKGKGGQRAVVLRKFKKDEVICRQGDPGWTAFYIPKATDLLVFKQAQAAAADEADKALAEVDPDLLKLSPVAKIEQADELERRSAPNQGLVEQLRTSAGRPSEAELRDLQERAKQSDSFENADHHVAEKGSTWLKLSADDRRALADQVAETNPETAELLRLSADGMDTRAAAKVSLAIQSTDSAGRKKPGFFARLISGSSRPVNRKKRGIKFIPIDGPVDLNLENPIATLYEGELFGEMSCINHYPRSATVRATRDCYMIEMLRNVLEILLENETFRQEMEEIYRRRVLANHLRSIPVFENVDDELLDLLRDRVELVTKSPGEMIFEEGDPSDSLYVIRIGTVKVFKREPGGERVIAYRSRGESTIGEMGMISGESRTVSCVAYEHPRTYKKAKAGAASSRVELVKIPKELFDEVASRFPDFKDHVEEIARTREQEQIKRESAPVIHTGGRIDHLGLMQGRKLMLIDLEKCTRCDECVQACTNTHDDAITRLLREGPRFGKFLVPSSCRQCIDPVCMVGCPVGSIHKGETAEIVIEDWCIGCSICAQQCPYESITMQEIPEKKAVTCDQCASNDSIPSCVYACPHDAALRVDAQEFFTTGITN